MSQTVMQTTPQVLPSSRIRDAAIPVSWITITRRLNTDELISLSEEVTRRGIPKDDLTQVREVFHELRVAVTAHARQRTRS